MLQWFTMLTLICALASGVLGFGAHLPPGWNWEKSLCCLSLFLAMISFVGSTMSRPSLFWELFDDFRGKQCRNRPQGQAHAMTGDSHD